MTAGNKKYDAASLGEVMLRLDPEDSRIRSTRGFRVSEGGGEYNVIKGLRKCFNLKTAVATAFADNEVGLLMEDLLLQAGVDTSYVYKMATNGTGSKCRNGVNFTERGFGLRGVVGCSDRSNTAISLADADELKLKQLFEEDGVRLFHTGGIYAGLSVQTRETLKTAIELAKQNQTINSFDLNYRASVWETLDEQYTAAPTARKMTVEEIYDEIIQNVDILLGNESEFAACLGVDLEPCQDPENDPLNIKGFEKLLREVAVKYPNLKVISAILHTVDSASQTSLVAIALKDGQIYVSQMLENVAIFDSVGAGDAYCAGFLYGILECDDLQKAVDYGVGCSALVMTTLGDNLMSAQREVEALLEGQGGVMKR